MTTLDEKEKKRLELYGRRNKRKIDNDDLSIRIDQARSNRLTQSQGDVAQAWSPHDYL